MIAVDSDMMLLEMARVLLAPDSARVRVVAADLGGLAWPGKMLAVAAMGADRSVALVSTMALHWLSLGDLAEFHGAAGDLLAPGGIVMNGDHVRFDSRWPTLEAVAKLARERAEREAVAQGEDDWATWWQRAETDPRPAPLKARDAFSDSRPPKRETSCMDCPVDFYVAAQRHAGFARVGTAWQMLDNYVVFRVASRGRPDGTHRLVSGSRPATMLLLSFVDCGTSPARCSGQILAMTPPRASLRVSTIVDIATIVPHLHPENKRSLIPL